MAHAEFSSVSRVSEITNHNLLKPASKILNFPFKNKKVMDEDGTMLLCLLSALCYKILHSVEYERQKTCRKKDISGFVLFWGAN